MRNKHAPDVTPSLPIERKDVTPSLPIERKDVTPSIKTNGKREILFSRFLGFSQCSHHHGKNRGIDTTPHHKFGKKLSGGFSSAEKKDETNKQTNKPKHGNTPPRSVFQKFQNRSNAL